MSDKCHPYPGTPVPPCPPCPPKPGRPCPPPPPPFKPLPGGTQQYIGARYVPVFAEPIEWDINKPYESLTIVTYQGNSYTSKCAVPGGTDITNTRYWAKTGDYNAQVAEYRAAVGDLSTQVTGFAKDNAEFREKIDQYDKDNAAMKNEVAASTARVDDLASRVDSAEADIDSLQATANQHTQKLADLEAADTHLAQSIAENDTDIANLQTKDVQHDSEISAIKTVNDQQGAAIAQNTADIAQNKKNIADNARNIAENAAEIAKHANTLKEHTADLAALHRDVQDNKTAIAKNASDIVGLRADLTEAEADIAQNTDGLNHVKADIVRIDAKDTEQDNIIGSWKTDHPGQTISQSIAENDTDIANLQTKDVQHDSEINAIKTVNDQQGAAIGNWTTDHPRQTISQCATAHKDALDYHSEQLYELRLATYPAAPFSCVDTSHGTNKSAILFYPSKIDNTKLDEINAEITEQPYLSVYTLYHDGVIRKAWFHITGNAVIPDTPGDPYNHAELGFQYDERSEVPTDFLIAIKVVGTMLTDYKPTANPVGLYNTSDKLNQVDCYLDIPGTADETL